MHQFSALRVITPALAIGLFATVYTPVEAAITPVTTSVRGIASAGVMPNPTHPPDSHLDSGNVGDFSVSSHDSDTSTDANGSLLSDVTITGSAHTNANGAAGSSTFHSVWTATNSKPAGNENEGGSFSIDMRHFYSFMNDQPVTILIDVTTSLTGTGNVGLGAGVMSVGHTVTFDGQFTDIAMNGPTHVQYNINPGFHQLQIDHTPNAGLSPWPNVQMTFDSNVSFSIVPEPATGMMLIALALPVLTRRRRVRLA